MTSTNFHKEADQHYYDDEEASEAEIQCVGSSLALAAGVLTTLCLGLVFWIC